LQEAEGGLGETEDLRQARADLQREESGLTTLRTRVRDLELEVKGLNGKASATEKRLYGGEVRNPKELASLQADLASLRARRDSLEDAILAGLTEMDEREARLRELRGRWQAVQSAWEVRQGELQASVSALRAQLVELDERIARLRAALPASLLEVYDEACRKKGGRGIAAIRGGLCEGCRVSVPTSIVQQVRGGEQIHRCTSCGRILCVVG
jgi:predicted  nucleic acid-binding Zn-ribbon protein